MVGLSMAVMIAIISYVNNMPRNWPFVRESAQVDSPTKGQ